jgi:hypothetical protein
VTGVLIHLFGQPEPVVAELPPLITTSGPTLNLCDEPVVSARCASLVDWDGVAYPCSGLLAYQGGVWQHVNACEDCYDSAEPCLGSIGHRSCDDPQPMPCAHGTCPEPADIEIPCTTGAKAGSCCGCCWVSAGHIDVDDAAGWAPTQRRWAE